MKSKILKHAILSELIHFESEDLNYFHNPFSSDIENIDCDSDDKKCWHSLDPSVSEKPLTLIIDLQATLPGVYTGKVKGFYLINEPIATLKTYEGDHGFDGNLEYYAFETPSDEIIQEVESPVEEISFGYKEGFKERLLDYLCH